MPKLVYFKVLITFIGLSSGYKKLQKVGSSSFFFGGNDWSRKMSCTISFPSQKDINLTLRIRFPRTQKHSFWTQNLFFPPLHNCHFSKKRIFLQQNLLSLKDATRICCETHFIGFPLLSFLNGWRSVDLVWHSNY